MNIEEFKKDICKFLEIDHHVIDLQKEFKEIVKIYDDMFTTPSFYINNEYYGLYALIAAIIIHILNPLNTLS